MSKGHGDYQCQFCDKKFDYDQNKKYHEQFCGVSELSGFENSNALRKIGKMSDALRRNHYDKNNSRRKPVKTRQTTF